MSNKPKIIVIMGPTAVGKTALSISLAKQFNGEIVNGDSLQVYRQLDIGTAKITKEEMAGIPHHLIDIVDIHEPYNASDFKKAAEEAIQHILEKGKLPIIVGGSGLYIQGLLNDMHFGNAGENPVYRGMLEEYLKDSGAQALWEKLNEVDPAAAENIHPNNSRRVIRALEAIHVSGILFSEQEDISQEPKFDALLIALNCDREVLYDRINRRVDMMVEAGVLDEARLLHELSDKEMNQAHKGIGYKEWFPYLDGRITFEEAIASVKQNSRRYAKRQLTWFRNRMKNVHWFDVTDQSYLKEVQQLTEAFRKEETPSKQQTKEKKLF
ncbi:tRNA (adenosine(37)-N6)-dimethylallyltransferase MiaA [Jeotgalibaca sp. A127]|uniref:tRNA (adenosine(37)-N6)-dimethylallyltransferase MiaA n=1 Tax=Jeotgalibaca sp. A127 TaxID=3457324 RepID=UPI003FD5156F